MPFNQLSSGLSKCISYHFLSFFEFKVQLKSTVKLRYTSAVNVVMNRGLRLTQSVS